MSELSRPSLRLLVGADPGVAAALLLRGEATVVLQASAWPPPDLASVSASVLDDGRVVSDGLPPLDRGNAPPAGALPMVPGATVSVRYRLLDGPCGAVDLTQHFVDGELGAAACEPDPEADVFVEISYRNYLRVRLGACSVVEALDGGRLFGATGPLSVLAGLLESPEYEAAWRAHRALPAALLAVSDRFPLEELT